MPEFLQENFPENIFSHLFFCPHLLRLCAPLEIILPRFCPGSKIFLAPPLHINSCNSEEHMFTSLYATCMAWLSENLTSIQLKQNQ